MNKRDTYTLEDATQLMLAFRNEGYFDASLEHERNADGTPTGRFVVTRGQPTDVPMQILRWHKRAQNNDN